MEAEQKMYMALLHHGAQLSFSLVPTLPYSTYSAARKKWKLGVQEAGNKASKVLYPHVIS